MDVQAFVHLNQVGHVLIHIHQQETQQHAHQFAETEEMLVLKSVTMEIFLTTLDA